MRAIVLLVAGIVLALGLVFWTAPRCTQYSEHGPKVGNMLMWGCP